MAGSLALGFKGCAPMMPEMGVDMDDLQGHWWVIEDDAGYLEFAIDRDRMYVCSPKYGKLYWGLTEIIHQELVQYEEHDSTKVRIKGKILDFDGDTLRLLYRKEVLEICIRINDSIPNVDPSGCFEGSAQRMKLITE